MGENISHGEHHTSHKEHSSHGEHHSSHGEHISLEVRKKVAETMKVDYILHKRVPRRFLELLIPEVVISIILYALHLLKVVTGDTYCLGHWIALALFWAVTWWLADKDKKNTKHIKHYYLCNLLAFAFFVLVAFITFLYNYLFSGRFPKDYVNFICFRLSYVLGLVNDKKIHTDEIIPSFIFFYGITLVIILVVPLVRKLIRKLKEAKERHDIKKASKKSSKGSSGKNSKGSSKERSAKTGEKHRHHHSREHEKYKRVLAKELEKERKREEKKREEQQSEAQKREEQQSEGNAYESQ